MRQRRFAGRERCFEIKREHALPGGDLTLVDALPDKAAGNVEQRIDAPGMCAYRRQRALSGCEVGDIDRDGEFTRRDVLLAHTPAKHGDVSALRLGQFRCGAAEHAESSGDDDGFAAHDASWSRSSARRACIQTPAIRHPGCDETFSSAFMPFLGAAAFRGRPLFLQLRAFISCMTRWA